MLDFEVELFECKRSIITLRVGIKYYMRGLICGFISYCTSRCNLGKINVNNNKNLTKTWKKMGGVNKFSPNFNLEGGLGVDSIECQGN